LRTYLEESQRLLGVLNIQRRFVVERWKEVVTRYCPIWFGLGRIFISPIVGVWLATPQRMMRWMQLSMLYENDDFRAEL
jgi:hypothetical protein